MPLGETGSIGLSGNPYNVAAVCPVVCRVLEEDSSARVTSENLPVYIHQFKMADAPRQNREMCSECVSPLYPIHVAVASEPTVPGYGLRQSPILMGSFWLWCCLFLARVSGRLAGGCLGSERAPQLFLVVFV